MSDKYIKAYNAGVKLAHMNMFSKLADELTEGSDGIPLDDTIPSSNVSASDVASGIGRVIRREGGRAMREAGRQVQRGVGAGLDLMTDALPTRPEREAPTENVGRQMVDYGGSGSDGVPLDDDVAVGVSGQFDPSVARYVANRGYDAAKTEAGRAYSKANRTYKKYKPVLDATGRQISRAASRAMQDAEIAGNRAIRRSVKPMQEAGRQMQRGVDQGLDYFAERLPRLPISRKNQPTEIAGRQMVDQGGSGSDGIPLDDDVAIGNSGQYDPSVSSYVGDVAYDTAEPYIERARRYVTPDSPGYSSPMTRHMGRASDAFAEDVRDAYGEGSRRFEELRGTVRPYIDRYAPKPFEESSTIPPMGEPLRIPTYEEMQARVNRGVPPEQTYDLVMDPIDLRDPEPQGYDMVMDPIDLRDPEPQQTRPELGRFNVVRGGYGKQLAALRGMQGLSDSDRELLNNTNYRQLAKAMGDQQLRYEDQIDTNQLLARLRDPSSGAAVRRFNRRGNLYR